MYDKFVGEELRDITDYLCKKDVITLDEYPKPIIKYTKTNSDNIVIIQINDGLHSTTYVEDMRDYFNWKTLRDRRMKLDKIKRNVH